MSSEFNADIYAPLSAVHSHRLDGLLSVSKLLNETQSQSFTTALDSSAQAHFDGPGRSMRSVLITHSNDYAPVSLNNHSERIGRYDQRPPLDDLGYANGSLQKSSEAYKKPSPWPVIAIVLALEVIVSIGVYTSHGKAQVQKSSASAAITQPLMPQHPQQQVLSDGGNTQGLHPHVPFR